MRFISTYTRGGYATSWVGCREPSSGFSGFWEPSIEFLDVCRESSSVEPLSGFPVSVLGTKCGTTEWFPVMMVNRSVFFFVFIYIFKFNMT